MSDKIPDNQVPAFMQPVIQQLAQATRQLQTIAAYFAPIAQLNTPAPTPNPNSPAGPTSAGAPNSPVPVAQTTPAPNTTSTSAPAPMLPFEQAMRQAAENINMVAEAEVRLAAAGQVSLGTWEKQAHALEHLNGQLDQNQVKIKGETANMKALKQAFTGVQKSALIATATTTGMYLELKHFASAASPGVFRSMEGAVQILTAEIGSALLPVMTDAVDGIMTVADWFESLDDGTKKLVAGGVVAVPALIGFGHAAAALSPVLTLATAAIRKMNAAAKESAMLSNLVRLAGPAGAVAAVAAALPLAVNNISTPSEEHGRPTEEEFEWARNLSSHTHGISADEWNALSPEKRREQAKQDAERLRGIEQRGERNFYTARHGYAYVGEGKAERAADILERFSQTGREGYEGKEEKRLIRRGRNLNMMITEASREQPAKYSPIAEARKQMQLSILNKNPFEQRLLEIQRKNVPKMREELERITRQLEELNRRERPH